jgi:hypothetical protein
VYAHETHAYEVIAEEPEMLRTSLKRSVAAARLIPEYNPDSSHSCRYYLIGIYESLEKVRVIEPYCPKLQRLFDALRRGTNRFRGTHRFRRLRVGPLSSELGTDYYVAVCALRH